MADDLTDSLEGPQAHKTTPVGGPLPPLSTSVPGHWETPEGAEMARSYSGRSRTGLIMGGLTDFNLANAQFMEDRNSPMLLHFQTAAKERIRWLSVQLAIARELLNDNA